MYRVPVCDMQIVYEVHMHNNFYKEKLQADLQSISSGPFLDQSGSCRHDDLPGVVLG